MDIPQVVTDDDVDLEACAAEPIHVPGAIQARGVLLVLDDGAVVQASSSVTDLLGADVEAALGRPAEELLGAGAVERLHLAEAAATGPLADNLHRVTIQDRPWVATAHRTAAGTVIVELEPLAPDAPDAGEAFRTAYALLRQASSVGSLQALYDLAARGVRQLTGFDRVMVYRFDPEHNGEVVAEARRDDLEPLLGLHYPASDIPPQARALYEKSWLRLISDVRARPARLVPVLHPRTGQPADLTFAGLRSVSPVHLQYLANMGVGASMSISLLDEGRLWGMVACHHYSGAHTPSLEVRAAAETLASGLSLQMVVRAAADRAQRAQAISAELTTLATPADDEPVGATIARPELLRLLDVDGAALRTGGAVTSVGTVPAAVDRVFAAARAAGTDVFISDALATQHPALAEGLGEVAGALVVPLPDGDALALFRREVTREVTWGGDPRSKTVTRADDGTVRIGPRRSFAQWRELVRGSSRPWTDDDVQSAVAVRRLAVEALYRRTRPEIGAALALQRSSLPDELPRPAGWHLQARYRPADGGRVGGDWYDAFPLPDGRIALAIGDVAGHGMAAASSMNQLRNGLRSLMVAHGAAAPAVEALDRLAKQLLPDDMATLLAGVLDPRTGTFDYVSAGHLPPLLVDDGEARWVEVVRNPPLGYLRGPLQHGELTIGDGQSLLLYTDGLVERRGTRISRRLEELRATAQVVLDLEVIEQRMSGIESDDDSTTLLVTAEPQTP
ncbi:SpoIIE family protein phosphatase [Puerhibacterium puerhi]|uniref:SpoIIE family protein phosphatase n=1 Tax=Puerhibacterium puerhi TaxID=2692623 RepID=UPI00135CB1CB|nr:SpoIIE family protein phosphatase [Puerhibacterium puerhi]